VQGEPDNITQTYPILQQSARQICHHWVLQRLSPSFFYPELISTVIRRVAAGHDSFCCYQWWS